MSVWSPFHSWNAYDTITVKAQLELRALSNASVGMDLGWIHLQIGRDLTLQKVVGIFKFGGLINVFVLFQMALMDSRCHLVGDLPQPPWHFVKTEICKCV